MIIVFTGNGKGKTTAALGQALRAVGQGKKVIIFQFIKSKNFPTGEDKAAKRFGNQLRIVKGGRGFVGILGDRLPRSAHKRAAEQTLTRAKKTISSKHYDLVILDEINVALHLGLLSKRKVLGIIKKAPPDIDLILTGRWAPKEFIKIADLVTHFEEVKHPFQKRVRARRGIEY